VPPGPRRVPVPGRPSCSSKLDHLGKFAAVLTSEGHQLRGEAWGHPEHAAYVTIHAIEALAHRFAAHPEDSDISQEPLKAELVTMRQRYIQGQG
jgi:hypothetical protein